VLWRFQSLHEGCLARSAGVDGFDLVATVPSSNAARDDAHPLRRLVGELIAPTRTRHRRLLVRSGTPVPERAVDPGKFNPTADLDGQSILLIDDMWTTGASVQGAAAAVKTAGAGAVGALVIGRHVNADYGDNSKRLKALPRPPIRAFRPGRRAGKKDRRKVRETRRWEHRCPTTQGGAMAKTFECERDGVIRGADDGDPVLLTRSGVPGARPCRPHDRLVTVRGTIVPPRFTPIG
jgi:hypothetical protein